MRVLIDKLDNRLVTHASFDIAKATALFGRLIRADQLHARGEILLRNRYPGLRLALREDVTADLLLRMEDGQLDFALIALPYDTPNLLVEPLFDDDLWIAGRKGNPEVKARKIHVTPLISDRLLLLEEGHCPKRTFA